MTTTPIDRSTSSRARTQHESCAVNSAPAPASFAFVASAHVPTTTEMNLWLGGDVQGSGFGSMYATKRIAPGRLDGMT